MLKEKEAHRASAVPEDYYEQIEERLRQRSDA